MRKINIGDTEVSGNSKVYFIAEAGVNHNGDIELAKELIDIAVEANADAVKFQTFSTDRITLKSAKKAKYQLEHDNENDSQYDMLKKLELSKEEHIVLKKYSDKKKITFLSTPYDKKSVDLLEEIGVKAFKVASGDLTNDILLDYIAQKDKPVILSTGMSYLSEVEHAVNLFNNKEFKKLILLHCVSNYPSDFESANLLCIKTLKEYFNTIVGFSDHTEGIGVAPFSVPLGARVIEKHFTLDKDLRGPDHKASLSPQELKKCIETIRKIEKSMGDGIKKPVLEETDNRKSLRKSIVTTKSIKKGEIIKEEALTSKRPGNGISPQYISNIIGKKAKRDVEENKLLKLDDIEGY